MVLGLSGTSKFEAVCPGFGSVSAGVEIVCSELEPFEDGEKCAAKEEAQRLYLL
jgi:hypothetical protein